MFTCNTCNRTFTSKFCATLHERSHAGDDSSASNSVGKYRCRHKGCKRTFEKLTSFVAHRSHHNSSLKYSSFKSMSTKITLKKTQRCIDLKERKVKQMTGRERKRISGFAKDGKHAQGHVRQGAGVPIKSTDNLDESRRSRASHSMVKLNNPDISPRQRSGQPMKHNTCHDCGPNHQDINTRDNRQGHYHGTNSQAPVNQIFVHQTFGTYNQMSQSSTNAQYNPCTCCDQKFGDGQTERGNPMKWVISGYGPVGCLYSCNKCQALFATEEHLVNHQAVHEISSYDTPNVGSIISLENFAKCYFADGRASLQQRRGRSLHCEECKLSFWREVDFERHLEANHAKYNRIDSKRNMGLESGRNAVDVDIKIVSAYSLQQESSNVHQQNVVKADKNGVKSKKSKQTTKYLGPVNREEIAEDIALDDYSEQSFTRKDGVPNRSIESTTRSPRSQTPPDQGVSERVSKTKGAPVMDRCVICGEETGGSSIADDNQREEGELPICESCNELVMEDDGDGDSSNESLETGNLLGASGSDGEGLDFGGDYTRLRNTGSADAARLSVLDEEQSSIGGQDSGLHTKRSVASDVYSQRAVESSQNVLRQGQSSVSSSAAVRWGYVEGDQDAEVARNNTHASAASALSFVSQGEQTAVAKTEGNEFGGHVKTDDKRRKRKNRPKESSHKKKKIKKEYDESTLSWEPRRIGYKSRHSLKLFTCVVCHHSFTRDWNLKNHMRTHTGERPFTCEFCNRTFVMKHHLKRHLGTHKGGGCKATLGYKATIKQEMLE